MSKSGWKQLLYNSVYNTILIKNKNTVEDINIYILLFQNIVKVAFLDDW